MALAEQEGRYCSHRRVKAPPNHDVQEQDAEVKFGRSSESEAKAKAEGECNGGRQESQANSEGAAIVTVLATKTENPGPCLPRGASRGKHGRSTFRLGTPASAYTVSARLLNVCSKLWSMRQVEASFLLFLYSIRNGFCVQVTWAAEYPRRIWLL